MTGRVLLLGIGSPFDEDQVGLRIVERLRDEGFSFGLDGVVLDFDTLDRPGWGLLDRLEGVDCAVLVDAMVSDRTPGALLRVPVDTLPVRNPVFASHEISLSGVLALGRALALLPERLILYGIEIRPGASSRPLDSRPPLEETVRTLRTALLLDCRALFPDRPVLS
jgi:hydrogenase maturation protease